jgi:hypothetical protein
MVVREGVVAMERDPADPKMQIQSRRIDFKEVLGFRIVVRVLLTPASWVLVVARRMAR